MYTLLPSWLALSAAVLFFPSATAFYPYHFGDSPPPGSPPSRVRSLRTSPLDDTNAPSPITLPLRRIVAPRQNTYSIVNSNTPKQSNSVAVDQDGDDLNYMIAVTFGTSKKVYHLLLDSAASNTWVMGAMCASDACKAHNTLGTGDSSSLKTDTKTFTVTYGTGSINGTLATDTLHIGSLSPSLIFGLATGVSEEFKSYPMDGIMGIGRGISTGNSIAAPQVMDALTSAKLISSKIYGIHLSRAKDNSPDGELDLGAVNKDRFSGDLNWLPAVDGTTTGFWEAQMADASVDGKSASLTGRTAILDTGTSYVLMPPSDAVALHALIPESVQDGETFSVPCSTSSTVQFSFGKQTYNISTADWKGGKLASGLCTSNIIGRQTFGTNQWLVGDVFLKNVYAVFDFDNQRVGFGTKSGTSSSSSSSSPSASANAQGSSPVPSSSSQTGKPGSSTGKPGAGSSTVKPSPGASAAPESQPNGQGKGKNSNAAAEDSSRGPGTWTRRLMLMVPAIGVGLVLL